MKFFSIILLLFATFTLQTKAQSDVGFPCAVERTPSHYLFDRCLLMTIGLRESGNYTEALANFSILLNSAQKAQDNYRIAQIKLHIGLTYYSKFQQLYETSIFGKRKQDISIADYEYAENYLNQAIVYVEEAVLIFDKILNKHLKESSFINANEILTKLQKIRKNFALDIGVEILIEAGVLEDLIKQNDDYLKVISQNMELNNSLLELIRVIKDKDKVWLNYTINSLQFEMDCDTNQLKKDFEELERLYDEFIKQSKISSHIKTLNTGSGTTEYKFQSKEIKENPQLYLEEITQINNRLTYIINENIAFTESLEACNKVKTLKEKINLASYAGLQLGTNHSYYSGNDAPQDNLFNPGFNFGVFFETGISDKNAIAIILNLAYETKGAKWEAQYLGELATFTSLMHYVQFQPVLSFKIYQNLRLQCGLNFGYLYDLIELPQVSSLLEESSLKANASNYNYKANLDQLEEVNHLDIGFLVGIEYEILDFDWSSINLALSYGLSLNNSPIIANAEINYSAITYNAFNLSFKWKFQI